MSAGRVDVRLDARDGGTLVYLTVDNRAKLNTLDRALMGEFVATVEALYQRNDLRALVLAGAGDKAFIGGASIPEMAALDCMSARDGAPDLRLLAQAACPVIAAISTAMRSARG